MGWAGTDRLIDLPCYFFGALSAIAKREAHCAGHARLGE